MAEYIVWVKQQGNCWERHDTDMLELAKLIRDQQRRVKQREALVTRLIQDDGFVEQAANAPEAAETPPATDETIAAGGTADGAPEPEAAAEPKADVEIQALAQLKAALETLDSRAVWRVAHWALEYARHIEKQQTSQG